MQIVILKNVIELQLYLIHIYWYYFFKLYYLPNRWGLEDRINLTVSSDFLIISVNMFIVVSSVISWPFMEVTISPRRIIPFLYAAPCKIIFAISNTPGPNWWTPNPNEALSSHLRITEWPSKRTIKHIFIYSSVTQNRNTRKWKTQEKHTLKTAMKKTKK